MLYTYTQLCDPLVLQEKLHFSDLTEQININEGAFKNKKHDTDVSHIVLQDNSKNYYIQKQGHYRKLITVGSINGYFLSQVFHKNILQQVVVGFREHSQRSQMQKQVAIVSGKNNREEETQGRMRIGSLDSLLYQRHRSVEISLFKALISFLREKLSPQPPRLTMSSLQ